MKTLAFILGVLSATPALAYIDASPSYLNFGDTAVGRRSFSEMVTVTNRGPDDITYINVFPSCGITFDVSQGSCFGRLAPYQSCYINVSFWPNREGYENCSINISSSSGSAYITATGRGVNYNYKQKAAQPRAMPKQK